MIMIDLLRIIDRDERCCIFFSFLVAPETTSVITPQFDHANSLSPDSNVIQTCAAEARGRGDGDVEPGAQAAARRGARNSVGAGDL